MPLIRLLRLGLVGGLLLLMSQAYAGIEIRQFDNPENQATYERLIYELRCLVCQNENLAASNAELAKDLRDEVYEMIVKKGMSEEEIKTFVVDRYGDFVLYRPPVKQSTWLLWGGPFLMLLLGFTILWFVLRANRQAKPAEEIMDEKERAEINALLADDKWDDKQNTSSKKSQ
ncbi:MAG TPA: cytochrome c-type biogenesis protein CcmH [Thiothrix sp.]|nr:cytochrome c-type biogenesis protein CcmH [Thiothrix sp.]